MKCHEVGDFVWVSIKSRKPFKTIIIEKVKENFYKIDWSLGGFHPILNTVSVCESALTEDEPV